MALLRFLGILLLVFAVAMVVYDVAIYLKGGAFALTSFEKFWHMAHGGDLFDLRSTLASILGIVGDVLADLPIVFVSAFLAVVCLALSRKRSRAVE